LRAVGSKMARRSDTCRRGFPPGDMGSSMGSGGGGAVGAGGSRRCMPFSRAAAFATRPTAAHSSASIPSVSIDTVDDVRGTCRVAAGGGDGSGDTGDEVAPWQAAAAAAALLPPLAALAGVAQGEPAGVRPGGDAGDAVRRGPLDADASGGAGGRVRVGVVGGDGNEQVSDASAGLGRGGHAAAGLALRGRDGGGDIGGATAAGTGTTARARKPVGDANELASNAADLAAGAAACMGDRLQATAVARVFASAAQTAGDSRAARCSGGGGGGGNGHDSGASTLLAAGRLAQVHAMPREVATRCANSRAVAPSSLVSTCRLSLSRNSASLTCVAVVYASQLTGPDAHPVAAVLAVSMRTSSTVTRAAAKRGASAASPHAPSHVATSLCAILLTTVLFAVLMTGG